MTESLETGISAHRVFTALFEELEEGAVVTDEEGRILAVNPRAAELLNCGLQDPRGRAFAELWEQRAFTGTLRTIALEGMESGGAIMLFREWKEREADRARTELLSLAAHQLRTPLAAVKLFTEMLLADASGVEERELLHNIERSNEKMISLIERFLSSSARSEGRLNTRRVPIDLGRFLERIVADANAFAELRGSAVVLTDSSVGAQTVDIDPHLLREVIDNLLANAITYSPSGSVVRIHLENVEGKWRITVADSGIGIPEAAKPHIFKKHYRAPNAAETNAEGSGLGLYMCDIIMESLGGTISFESEEGNGTVFIVCF